MLAIRTELSRKMSYPKVVIIWGFSACIILSFLWRAGFYLEGSNNHGGMILRLDRKQVINCFVNLPIEKIP